MDDAACLQKLEAGWEMRINWNRQGFMRHAEDHRVDRKTFDRLFKAFDLWYVAEGNAFLERSDGAVFCLERGTLVFHRKGMARRLWQPPGAARLTLAWFHFDLVETGTGRKIPEEEVAWLPWVSQSESIELMEAICMKILRIGLMDRKSVLRLQQERLARQLLKAMLFSMSCLGTEPGASGGMPVRNVKRYREVIGMAEFVRHHPGRFPSAREMAASLGISTAHFSRLFKEVTGQAPSHFLIEARIIKAKQFLSGSDLTVTQIAEEIGYADASFFCRQFKKVTGCTPVTFRVQR
ncbi:MAG TPA: AraC family transcriptional regulator [Chthoniobacteraceae bacterium]|nr:AraC family transcriptional regulator [Chthoniobacteraceae bacterium]